MKVEHLPKLRRYRIAAKAAAPSAVTPAPTAANATVVLSTDISLPSLITVGYWTPKGSAVSDADYAGTSETITFAVGSVDG